MSTKFFIILFIFINILSPLILADGIFFAGLCQNNKLNNNKILNNNKNLNQNKLLKENNNLNKLNNLNQNNKLNNLNNLNQNKILKENNKLNLNQKDASGVLLYLNTCYKLESSLSPHLYQCLPGEMLTFSTPQELLYPSTDNPKFSIMITNQSLTYYSAQQYSNSNCQGDFYQVLFDYYSDCIPCNFENEVYHVNRWYEINEMNVSVTSTTGEGDGNYHEDNDNEVNMVLSILLPTIIMTFCICVFCLIIILLTAVYIRNRQIVFSYFNPRLYFNTYEVIG